MNPTATRRLRRSSAIVAVTWALLALVLAGVGQFTAQRGANPPIETSGIGGYAIVQWATEAAVAAGVSVGDRVLEVDGEPIHSWFRDRGWERLSEAVPVRYTLETRDGRVFRVSLRPVQRSSTYTRFFVPIFAASLVVGVAYLAIGLLVWRFKPDTSASWAFLLFCSAVAAQLATSIHTYDALWGYPRMLINLPLVGATTFHLFTTIPREPEWVVKRPRLRLVPYALAGLFALWVVAEGGTAHSEWLPKTAFGSAFLGAGAGLVILAHERFVSRETRHAGRTDVIFLGALLSFAPVLLTIAAQLVLRVTFPTSLALLWWVVFPLAVAYGIARRQLFDIRGTARSSAAYGAATLAITGLFALLITFADATFSRFRMNSGSGWFSVIFLFFAILAFNPLRLRLQSLVDRVFDRDRAGYRNAVQRISEAMVSMLSLDEIGDRLLLAVTDTMGVERGMVLLIAEDERSLAPAAWRGDWEEGVVSAHLPLDHVICKHLWMRRQELTREDFDETLDPETREACQDVFDSLEVELLVPILYGVDLLGLIAVGRKLSGESLSPDDRQLMRTLANQSAIAIENARAFDEIAKLNESLEARVEERTRELRQTQAQLLHSEKMRSLGQLVAGVAHELNNPIGFVHANLQLLDGYVDKLMHAQQQGAPAEKAEDAIAKLLSRSREGTQRVKQIVQDLRTFSRMDQADLAEVDLNEEIERTLTLMESRLRDGIRVEKDFGQLPRVRCFAGQLNQVFMNLLINACDALDGGGRIEVRTRSATDGVHLEFVDDGPGIEEAVRERIFEPFFTTKPVGKGTGLGLSISHGIVERHGGHMDVECPREGGTVFRIELPLEAVPTVEAAEA